MNLFSLLGHLSHGRHREAMPLAAATERQKPSAAGKSSSGIVAARAGASASGTVAGQSASGNSSTITANDFLTLLVTEIQNQDPTQQTDPMQYVSQLVGVNSLEQLIQINQAVSGVAGSSSSAASAPLDATSSSAHGAAGQSLRSLAARSGTGERTGNSSHASTSLPLGSNAQVAPAAVDAVAQAFSQKSTTSTSALPPTQIPLSPEVMRALQRSIPGAALVGQSPVSQSGLPVGEASH